MTQNDRNDPGLTALVTLQSALHFDIIEIVGCQESHTDEQKDEVSTIQMIVNLSCPIASSEDGTIMPGGEQTLAV
jgi:hypothetical protein